MSISLLFFLPVFARAFTLEIMDPCADLPVHRAELRLAGDTSLGQATISVLNRDRIPYIGSELGLNSILHTPVDRDAMEFPAPGEIRAYGWCFELNGEQSEKMPDELRVKEGDRARWFYAFALYSAGEWVSYCVPAYTVKPKAVCR